MTTPSSNAKLTDEELRIKVAELRGWTQSHQQPPDFETDIRMWEKDGKYRYTHNLPPLTLDEIHEAEKMLTIDQVESYILNLTSCVHPDNERMAFDWIIWHATARARAEAFIKTMENS